MTPNMRSQSHSVDGSRFDFDVESIAGSHSSIERAAIRDHTNSIRADSPPPPPPPSDLESLLLRLLHQVPEAAPVASKGGLKARPPNHFDGSDRTKLRPFLSACRLVFLNHPDHFHADRPKVLYAGSYLGGTAAEWFEPLTRRENFILDNWDEFTRIITLLFGEPDEVASAERQLLELKMKDSQQASVYITKF